MSSKEESEIHNRPHFYINYISISYKNVFFFQALNFLVESFGLLNNLFPFPPILDAD
jgi:hypothetical protein